MGNLTAAAVRSAKVPGKYYDQHGLIMRVSPGGSKQWIWRGTIRGRRRDIGLGAVTYTSLAEARDMAYEYRKVARSGGDPTAWHHADPVPTFAEIAERVIEIHRGGWKQSGGSERNWRSSLRRYVYPSIGAMPIDVITTADLVRVLLPVWHSKRETARKIKTRISIVMRYAIGEGHRKDDPTGMALSAALPRHNGTPTKHLASLSHNELPSALARLAATQKHRPTMACLLFIAATVVRSGEARLAMWDEIDFDAGVWTVPAERTKTSRTHVVPLSSVAMTALESCGGGSGGDDGSGSNCVGGSSGSAHGGSGGGARSGLIFVSPTGITLTNGSLSRFTRVEGFTPHGLRASFRTWCAETGVARELAEAALAHSPGVVERAYQRSDLLAARSELMENWAKALMGHNPKRRAARLLSPGVYLGG